MDEEAPSEEELNEADDSEGLQLRELMIMVQLKRLPWKKQT